ncbi:hypothetical protein Lalb_Chr10g0093621 [Lupinus albus]|uniref:Uncharacterized protein n=1 Tax=Lupinus albus TaxID=3870 RepID=A0A6A4PUY2_LUPAL|nr:hypothetical protein Lalb_Chr10g0093621 [Lupinus albus]
MIDFLLVWFVFFCYIIMNGLPPSKCILYMQSWFMLRIQNIGYGLGTEHMATVWVLLILLMQT